MKIKGIHEVNFDYDWEGDFLVISLSKKKRKKQIKQRQITVTAELFRELFTKDNSFFCHMLDKRVYRGVKCGKTKSKKHKKTKKKKS